MIRISKAEHLSHGLLFKPESHSTSEEMPQPATDVIASEHYTDDFSIAISR